MLAVDACVHSFVAGKSQHTTMITGLICSYNLDISCTVIKKGSPHHLLLTKNKNGYLHKLKIFNEVVELLGR